MLTRSTTPQTQTSNGLAAVINIATWIAQVLIAAFLFIAGAGKLVGQAPMVELFADIGVGQWFRYFTGVLEVAGAVLLVVPRFVVTGAVLLAVVMAGAVAAHVFVIGGSTLVPLVLLAVLLTLGCVRARERSWNID